MSRGPLQILHIEDDAGDRELLELAMRRVPGEVSISVALDGEEAWEKLTNPSKPIKVPELILLDLNLPKKDGRQLLGEIKADLRLKLIPVVVLTTSNALTDIEACYRHGAACYMIKPIDFSELVELARKLFEFWRIVELPPAKLLGGPTEAL